MANPDGASLSVTEAANMLLSKSEHEKPTEEAKTDDLDPEVETPEGDPEPEAQKYKVGEEELTIDDLIKGNMMERDYRKKTAQVAEMRRDFEGKLSALDEKITDAQGLLDIDMEFFNSDEGIALKEDDPEKYLRRLERVQNKAKKLDALKDKYKNEQQKREPEMVKKEQELLISAVPDWLDESTKNKESKAILEYLAKSGYTDQDLADIRDHRVFVMARDAMRFREIQSQDLSKKQDKTPPKVAKPSAKQTQDKSREEVAKLKERYKETGDKNAALEIFKRFV